MSLEESTALVHTIIEPRRGGWKKGQSGNPGGRRTKLISEALREELEQIEHSTNKTNAQLLAKRLINNALYGKPSDSTVSIGLVADRTEGKAVQQVRITQTIDENTAKRLVDLAERLGINTIPQQSVAS